jgi:predicted O-methyltransferase YrrM
MSAPRTFLKNALSRVPFVKERMKHNSFLLESFNKCGYEPGHYYSPIPDLDEVENNSETIFNKKKLENIDLNIEKQLSLLSELKEFYSSYPYNSKQNEDSLRYKKEDAWYRFSDAVFLYCMLRRFQPRKIIEVGSGHSSAIMLDTNEYFLENVQFTFIEPYPEERLLKILKDTDKENTTVINKKVQAVELALFQTLDENDILFIDSTHVSKVGSDVNHLIFDVLPSLKPGVLIHFHDIFYPFELPKHWIMEKKWFWNENYLLRAFLINNKQFEIVNFNTLLQSTNREWFEKEMPECLLGAEDTGSIWIRKVC